MTDYTLGSAPRGLPLLGHALHLFKDPCGFLSSLPAHGDLVRIKLGLHPAIVVCHPELTYRMLAEDRIFDKGGPLVDRGRELFGDSLALCGHAQHRRQRRLIQPAFHKNRLPGYAAVMTKGITALVERWTDGTEIDVRDQMRAFTSQVTIDTMFGATLTEAGRDQMLDDLSTLLSGTYKRMFLPAWFARLPTPGNRRYERTRQRLRDTIGGCISEYRATRTDHGDALSMLLAVEQADDSFTDNEVIDQLVILFVGGSDTTANTLGWALHLLSEYPDVRRALHEEVDQVLAGRAATFDDLENLPWTAHVITETLRLYPPVAMVTRTVTTDTTLGGHPINAGSTVIYSALAVQRRPDIFTCPAEFDPTRWTAPAIEPARGALTPFGGGPRKCVGDNFGTTMAAIALASITATWTLQPLKNQKVTPTLRTFLSPHNLKMTPTPRTP